jgi:hypothetical protein
LKDDVFGQAPDQGVDVSGFDRSAESFHVGDSGDAGSEAG